MPSIVSYIKDNKYGACCHKGLYCLSPLPLSFVFTLFFLSLPHSHPGTSYHQCGRDVCRHLCPSCSLHPLTTTTTTVLSVLAQFLAPHTRPVQSTAKNTPCQTCSSDSVPSQQGASPSISCFCPLSNPWWNAINSYLSVQSTHLSLLSLHNWNSKSHHLSLSLF